MNDYTDRLLMYVCHGLMVGLAMAIIKESLGL